LQSSRERITGLLVVGFVALVVAGALAVLQDWWWARCQPLCPGHERAVILGLFVLAVECALALPVTLALPRRVGWVLGIAVALVVGFAVLALMLDGTSGLTYCGDMCGG
jgi:hypothetical protein